MFGWAMIGGIIMGLYLAGILIAGFIQWCCLPDCARPWSYLWLACKALAWPACLAWEIKYG